MRLEASTCRYPTSILLSIVLCLAAHASAAGENAGDQQALSGEVRKVETPSVARQSRASDARKRLSFEHYIRMSAVPTEVLNQWLRAPSWTKFDPELGYVLANSIMPWGIDGSATIETIDSVGARKGMMYADRKPRINTYGDSFTECNQVSDGETWQEYLAGHLGEPIRNFGVGGYGVYQAYRRMLREEATDHAAKVIILTICCDDSMRSLLRYRRALFFSYWPEYGGATFHGNFWSNLEMDLDSGRFVEKEQMLATKDSLFHMTEPEWMVEHLKDDLALQLALYSGGDIEDLDRERTSKLAAALNFPFDWEANSKSATETSARQASEAQSPTPPLQLAAAALLNRYSQRATIFIIGKAQEFARRNGKQLLIVLNGNADIREMKERGTRADRN